MLNWFRHIDQVIPLFHFSVFSLRSRLTVFLTIKFLSVHGSLCFFDIKFLSGPCVDDDSGSLWFLLGIWCCWIITRSFLHSFQHGEWLVNFLMKQVRNFSYLLCVFCEYSPRLCNLVISIHTPTWGACLLKEDLRVCLIVSW